jgi:DNA mismatch repair protein MSH6
VLFEKGKLSKETRDKIRVVLGDVILNCLAPQTEFWSAATTSENVKLVGYFLSGKGNSQIWPRDLQDLMNSNSSLAVSAFGACVWYLQYVSGLILLFFSPSLSLSLSLLPLCFLVFTYLHTHTQLMIDKEVVPLGNFRKYDPYNSVHTHMILDGQTLQNLEVLANNRNGTTTDTLLGLVDRCQTSMGKRLLKRWICYPLIETKDIEERLDAIDNLNTLRDTQEIVAEKLSKLGDIERLVTRAKTSSLRLSDFLSVLQDLKEVQRIVLELNGSFDSLFSSLLKRLLRSFPPLGELLAFFTESFDHERAKNDGTVTPFFLSSLTSSSSSFCFVFLCAFPLSVTLTFFFPDSQGL